MLSKLVRDHARIASETWARYVGRGASEQIDGSYPEALRFGALTQQRTGVASASVATDGLFSRGLARWHRSGAPQFTLTANATAAFMLTDVDGLSWGDVRFPFKDFMVWMPSPSPLVFDSFDGVETRAASVLVSQCELTTMSNTEIAHVMENISRAQAQGAPLEVIDTLFKKIKTAPGLFVIGNDERFEGFHTVYLFPDDPTTPLAEWAHPERRQGEWQSDRSAHAAALLCRILACLTLYLDHSEGPEKRWDPSLLDRNRAKGREATTWDVGAEIKLPTSLREAARLLGRADRAPAQWEVASRTLVRGYWRNQPCGPKGTQRRKRWIEPYYRGPETTDIVDRLYRVGSDDQVKGAG